ETVFAEKRYAQSFLGRWTDLIAVFEQVVHVFAQYITLNVDDIPHLSLTENRISERMGDDRNRKMSSAHLHQSQTDAVQCHRTLRNHIDEQILPFRPHRINHGVFFRPDAGNHTGAVNMSLY